MGDSSLLLTKAKFSICFVRSLFKFYFIWNDFVRENIPMLASGEDFPPCKQAVQVSLRLLQLTAQNLHQWDEELQKTQ